MTQKLLLATLLLLLTACNSGGVNDSNSPQLTLSIPEDYVDPSLVQVTVQATDNSGITKVTIERKNTDDSAAPYTLLKTVTSAPFSFTYTDTLPGSGTYTYRVTAQNASGKSRINTLNVSAKVPTPLSSLSGTLTEPGGTFAYPLTTQPWSGGAGQIILETSVPTPQPITQAALTAAGQFVLDLTQVPGAAEQLPATPQNLLGSTSAACTGNAASSTPNARMTVAHLRVAANKTGVAAPFQWLPPIPVTFEGKTLQSTALSLSGLIYANQAIKFTGALSCSLGSGKSPVTVNMPLHLYKGWNKVTVQTVTDSSGQISSVTWSYDFPAGTNDQWLLLPRAIPTAP